MLEATPIPIAAGSLVIGVITFMVTEIGKWRRARRSETRQWQLDAIGTILSEQKSHCSDFEDIKARYLRAADTHKDFNIPKRYKQDNEIRRALFDLQSKGIISQDSAGHYKIRRDRTESEIEEKLARSLQDTKKLLDEVMQSVLAQSTEQQNKHSQYIMENVKEFQSTFVSLLQQQEEKIENYYNEEKKHKTIQKALLEIIAKKPGVYTAEEACVEVMDTTKQDRVYVMIQLINLFSTAIIRIDDTNRLRLSLYAVKPSEMALASN